MSDLPAGEGSISASLEGATADALQFLITLSRDHCQPDAALSRLSHLRADHPGVGMDLLWERETYDESVHYDLLLRAADGDGTVSLSFCPDKALPWPMRGVHRWTEQDLVRVNNTVLRVHEAVAFLDVIWNETRIAERIINACLILEVLQEQPVEISDDQLQAALDGFRRARGLLSADRTQAWLKQHGLTHPQLEQRVSDELALAQLRARIAEGRIESHFELHRADFDTASVAWLVLEDAEAATRAARSSQDFYQAAQLRFTSAKVEEQHHVGQLFRRLRRSDLSSELAELIFGAAPDEIVGPVAESDGFAVVKVLQIAPAKLDPATSRTIERQLFQEWLAERRRGAMLEWYWGSRTDPDARPS
jgi:putative peptide maturation system protein